MSSPGQTVRAKQRSPSNYSNTRGRRSVSISILTTLRRANSEVGIRQKPVSRQLGRPRDFARTVWRNAAASFSKRSSPHPINSSIFGGRLAQGTSFASSLSAPITPKSTLAESSEDEERAVTAYPATKSSAALGNLSGIARLPSHSLTEHTFTIIQLKKPIPVFCFARMAVL